MPVIEVKNQSGQTTWRSPDVAQPIVEVVENHVKVTDFDTGQVIATYQLKPGERMIPITVQVQIRGSTV